LPSLLRPSWKSENFALPDDLEDREPKLSLERFFEVDVLCRGLRLPGMVFAVFCIRGDFFSVGDTGVPGAQPPQPIPLKH
jgi:hypothetical protein